MIFICILEFVFMIFALLLFYIVQCSNLLDGWYKFGCILMGYLYGAASSPELVSNGHDGFILTSNNTSSLCYSDVLDLPKVLSLPMWYICRAISINELTTVENCPKHYKTVYLKWL